LAYSGDQITKLLNKSATYNIIQHFAFNGHMRPFFWIILCLVGIGGLMAQTPGQTVPYHGRYILETVVVNGDTIPVVTLQTAQISSERKARSKRYQRKWDKLQRNVVKTYPYAEVAGQLILAYNENLTTLETEAERQAYLDRCEEDLKAEFEGDLRKMTTSQGRVLIKLIDRESGKTSYELVKDLKSGFSAFMWQGVAKLFGTDLKDHYDPLNSETDYMIEEIVGMIESGQIAVATRLIKTPEAAEVLKESDVRLQRRIAREKRRNS